MLHKIPLLSLLSSCYFHFFQFTLFSHCNVVLCMIPICLFWGSGIRIPVPTGSMSACSSWLCHTNATLRKHVYYKIQGVFNQSSTVKVRSWGSNPEPWRVSSLSIKKMWKELESINRTITPDLSHFLSYSCPLFIPFSSYPKSQFMRNKADVFHYLSQILLLFIPYINTIQSDSFTVRIKELPVFTGFFNLILLAIKK